MLKDVEIEIIENAITALMRATGMQISKKNSQVGEINKHSKPEIKILLQNKQLEFKAEVKKYLNTLNIGTILPHIDIDLHKYIIIAPYISSPLAKKMKELNIQFIDTAGNTYINNPGIFIYIIGNKIPNDMKNETRKKIFDVSGLKIIFTLLCNPELLNTSYRVISSMANVSLGSVSNIFKELSRKGYIVEGGSLGRRLQNKNDLFNKWVIQYSDTLRSGNLIGKYKAHDPDFWRFENISIYNAFWGGEVAANKLTNNLNPEIITIYTSDPINNLVLKSKLHKTADGNIEIRNKFWNFEEKSGNLEIVPEILIYADLMSSADSRNIETAKIIYEKYIERYLGKD
jgi:hypothetical protein